MNVFTCPIMNLILTGTCPLNAKILYLNGDFFINTEVKIFSFIRWWL